MKDLIVDKNYKGLVDEGWRFVLNGDLTSEANIKIELNKHLFVTGSIKAGHGIEAGWSIEAGGGIEARWSIEAGNDIKAGGGIEAGHGIEAGWGIEAGGGIEAGYGIEAGEGIEAGLSINAKWLNIGLRIFAGLCIWKNPSDEEMTITCEEIKNGEVAFGKLNLIPKEETKVELTLEDIANKFGIDIDKLRIKE